MLAFRVLGPLSVRVDDREISPASVRQRRLLAALLLRVGRPVPMAALVEAAWGDRPPRSAVNSAQSHISRLRRLLGSDAVGWTGTGYVLRAAPITVDAYLFESFMDQARSSEEHWPCGTTRRTRILRIWKPPRRRGSDSPSCS
jgi:DNA-binding SARP family transcriptional activator